MGYATRSAPSLPRRLFVFDKSYTNVALNKATTSSGQFTGDAVAYSADNGVNGIIQMDGVSGATVGDLTYMSACDGSAWWQVDLGGIYNISRVVLFNRASRRAVRCDNPPC